MIITMRQPIAIVKAAVHAVSMAAIAAIPTPVTYFSAVRSAGAEEVGDEVAEEGYRGSGSQKQGQLGHDPPFQSGRLTPASREFLKKLHCECPRVARTRSQRAAERHASSRSAGLSCQLSGISTSLTTWMIPLEVMMSVDAMSMLATGRYDPSTVASLLMLVTALASSLPGTTW